MGVLHIVRSLLKDVEKLLEVGCGRGYFLESCKGHVGEAMGIEFNNEAIASKVTGFPIRIQPIEEFSHQNAGRFDAVCSFQVLEHISAPYEFILAASRCLSPGGVLVLSTPNHASPLLHAQMDAFDLPPHHMGYFDVAIFRRIAKVLDLDVVNIVSEPRKHASEPVTGRTRDSYAYRFLRRVAKRSYEVAYRLSGEPGLNLLAVLRKRSA